MSTPDKFILLLEDNDDDAFITERALTKAGVSNKVHRCQDGQDLIDYLSALSEKSQTEANKGAAEVPYLVLLDLKTPRKSGLEVLQWIRNHAHFGPLVVLALTSSSEKSDVERAYQLHVNAYLVKPTSLSTMTELAQSIKRLWLDPSSLMHPSFAFPMLLGLHLLPGHFKP
jgi:CheY-like chemotaxis protein